VGEGGTKNRTYWRSFTSAVRASLRGIRGPSLPRKIMNLHGIGGDEISRCLEGLTCTLQSLLSRYSISFSFPAPPVATPSLFLCKIGQITRPIFSKSEGTYPTDPLVRGSDRDREDIKLEDSSELD